VYSQKETEYDVAGDTGKDRDDRQWKWGDGRTIRNVEKCSHLGDLGEEIWLEIFSISQKSSQNRK